MTGSRTKTMFPALPILFGALFLCHGGTQAKMLEEQKLEVQKPKVEVNREPIPYLDLMGEPVEILPDGVRKLGSMSSNTNLRVGSTGGGRLQLEGSTPFRFEAKLLELSKNGMRVQLKITDDSTKKILADRTLSLDNYQEVFVELASSASGSRMGIRFIPTVRIDEPVLDWPMILKRFGIEDGLLILNSKEVLSEGHSGWSSIDKLNGETLQFLTFENRRLGKFWLSYRPFPGAATLGYIEGRRLIFGWNGEVFEWISIQRPILPEGKWSLYVAHEDKVSPDVTGDSATIGFTARALKDFK